MPFHPPLPLIDHGADDVWCHFPPEGFEAISTLARFTHATIDWDRATLDNSHFQPPHVLCSCRYIVNLSNSGTKKERFFFVALWGLGRPIRKHEKRHSKQSAPPCAFVWFSEGPNFRMPQSTVANGKSRRLCQKKKDAIFLLIAELLIEGCLSHVQGDPYKQKPFSPSEEKR